MPGRKPRLQAIRESGSTLDRPALAPFSIIKELNQIYNYIITLSIIKVSIFHFLWNSGFLLDSASRQSFDFFSGPKA